MAMFKKYKHYFSLESRPSYILNENGTFSSNIRVVCDTALHIKNQQLITLSNTNNVSCLGWVGQATPHHSCRAEHKCHEGTSYTQKYTDILMMCVFVCYICWWTFLKLTASSRVIMVLLYLYKVWRCAWNRSRDKQYL